MIRDVPLFFGGGMGVFVCANFFLVASSCRQFFFMSANNLLGLFCFCNFCHDFSSSPPKKNNGLSLSTLALCQRRMEDCECTQPSHELPVHMLIINKVFHLPVDTAQEFLYKPITVHYSWVYGSVQKTNIKT